MSESRTEAILNGTETIEDGQSRIGDILIAIRDGTEYTGKPQSRIEKLLLEIKEQGGGGGGGSDDTPRVRSLYSTNVTAGSNGIAYIPKPAGTSNGEVGFVVTLCEPQGGGSSTRYFCVVEGYHFSRIELLICDASMNPVPNAQASIKGYYIY